MSAYENPPAAASVTTFSCLGSSNNLSGMSSLMSDIPTLPPMFLKPETHSLQSINDDGISLRHAINAGTNFGEGWLL